MVQEVYPSRWSHKPYMSPYKIRQQQKKALQSYRNIDTIKQRANHEADKALDEAEKELQQFIISWTDHNDK